MRECSPRRQQTLTKIFQAKMITIELINLFSCYKDYTDLFRQLGSSQNLKVLTEMTES